MARITTAQFDALVSRVEACESTIAALPSTVGQAVATALSTTLGSYSTPTLVAEAVTVEAPVVTPPAQPTVTRTMVTYTKHDGSTGTATPAAFEARQRIATAAGKPLTVTGTTAEAVKARPTTEAGRKGKAAQAAPKADAKATKAAANKALAAALRARLGREFTPQEWAAAKAASK